LFCMQVLTIVPSVAPSGCRLRTSSNGISLALLFQHAFWRWNMHFEGVPPATGHEAVLALWDPTYGYGKDMSLPRLKAILAKVWTSWRLHSVSDMRWSSWEQILLQLKFTCGQWMLCRCMLPPAEIRVGHQF
jgi:hypothetical protein